MTHRAMMIDLETLGLGADATIISGAAVVTDLDNPEWNYGTPALNYKFYLDQGRVIDPKTLEWHLNQPTDIIEANLKGSRVKLIQFLLDIALTKDITTYWSKGVDFDIAILENAYKQVGGTIPWNYRQKRCFRTVEAWMPELSKELSDNPYKANHTALGDALSQARILHYLCREYRKNIVI